MKLNDLQKNVEVYTKDREYVNTEQSDLFQEMDELYGILPTVHKEDPEVAAVFAAYDDALRRKNEEFQELNDQLDSRRQDLLRDASDQRQEIQSAQEQINPLIQNKYGKNFIGANKKCLEALAQLDALIDSLAAQNSIQEHPSNARVMVDGVYYQTDDNGQIHLQRGDDGQYHTMPNKTYVVNSYTYQTNERSQIVHAEGRLHLSNSARKSINVIVDDMTSLDQRSHIIADIFDGSHKNDNLLPQLSTLNQGKYKSLELYLKSLLENNHTVYCRYDMHYSSPTKRPDCFTVSYSIDGGNYFESVDFFNDDRE